MANGVPTLERLIKAGAANKGVSRTLDELTIVAHPVGNTSFEVNAKPTYRDTLSKEAFSVFVGSVLAKQAADRIAEVAPVIKSVVAGPEDETSVGVIVTEDGLSALRCAVAVSLTESAPQD